MDRKEAGKQLASVDEPPIELCLDTIMPSLLLAELCELDQSRNLGLKHGKICATGTGVKSLCS